MAADTAAASCIYYAVNMLGRISDDSGGTDVTVATVTVRGKDFPCVCPCRRRRRLMTLLAIGRGPVKVTRIGPGNRCVGNDRAIAVDRLAEMAVRAAAVGARVARRRTVGRRQSAEDDLGRAAVQMPVRSRNIDRRGHLVAVVAGDRS